MADPTAPESPMAVVSIDPAGPGAEAQAYEVDRDGRLRPITIPDGILARHVVDIAGMRATFGGTHRLDMAPSPPPPLKPPGNRHERRAAQARRPRR